MAVQLRVMSWNIEKKTTNATFIAELMRLYQIDICALLEVPNGNAGMILNAIVAALNNLATAYHQNEWLSHPVNVGNEAVGYVWHQNANVAVNAFQVDLKANGGQRVAGPVTRNAANARIYFPKKQTTWGGLPGTPAGRRPGYLSFVTNDGAAARRFTVLDLHTPFADANNATTSSIQSYSTALYATSREITQVDRTDQAAIATAASVGLSAAMAVAVDAVINQIANNAVIVPATLRGDAVTGASAAIDGDEIDLKTVLLAAGRAGAVRALTNITLPVGISRGDANRLARAAAMAGAGAATTMVASVQLPTGPLGAPASAGAARGVAMTNASNVVGQFAFPNKRSPSAVWTAIRLEAERISDAALAPFTFNALPLTAVNTAIIAGDFNVDYPDNANNYALARQNLMGGGGNHAYTRLIALGAATNTVRTTRIGPSAYWGKRVYTLHNPSPIQSNQPAVVATYVPLSVATLQATVTNFVDNDSWSGALRTLAQNQGIAWATIENSATYTNLLQGAFDTEVIDNSNFFRANCYDNIFVRGAVGVGASGTIDVISELGSWPARAAALPNPQPALAANPWAAATGRLNALAQAVLGVLVGPLTYTYTNSTYTITVALADAEDAAIFFDRYISDHLPVYVQVTV